MPAYCLRADKLELIASVQFADLYTVHVRLLEYVNPRVSQLIPTTHHYRRGNWPPDGPVSVQEDVRIQATDMSDQIRDVAEVWDDGYAPGVVHMQLAVILPLHRNPWPPLLKVVDI